MMCLRFRPTNNKQLITEEKVVASLNSLHISPDYKQQDQQQANVNEMTATKSDLMSDLEEIAASQSNKLCPLELDIEEKLRRANRITVCEELSKLTEDPILPKAILERFERPSNALVLWQPPKKIAELIVPRNQEENQSNEDEMDDNEMDNFSTVNNNNDNSVDLNYDASMDLDNEL